MNYNGYTNRATWNVCLWLDNVEVLYNRTRNMSAKNLCLYCQNVWGDKTPDGFSLSKVNWSEVKENCEE